MAIETLRALSRAYADGEIDRDGYRRTRRELLTKIAQGELPALPYIPPDPPAPTVFPSTGNDGDTTQEIIPGSLPAQSKAKRAAGDRRLMLIGAGLAALALIGGLGFFAFQHFSKPGAPAPVEQTTVADSTLIDGFLAANVWTPVSINELKAQSDALPATSKAAFAQSESARRLASSVLQQIRAEDALIDLGETEDALESQGQLLDLVDHLGISNERLADARKVWNERSSSIAPSASTASSPGAAAPTAPETVVAGDAGEPATATDVATADVPPPPREAGAAGPLNAETVAPAPTTAAPPVVTPEPEPAAVAAVHAAEPAAPAPKQAASAPKPAAAAKPVAPAKPVATTAKKSSAGPRTNCSAGLTKSRKPYCMDIAANGIKGPVLVVLSGGDFEMGGREANEQPRHKVSLSAPFAIGVFEVSAAEFAMFCKTTNATCPAQPWDEPDLPAVNVSWAQAQAYAKWLSGLMNAEYRLPSEAEWEYVARGGSTTEYPLGDELVPTHARYSFRRTEGQPLAANDRSLNRNGFRVYHIIGNVREWVADSWAANYAGAPSDGSARAGGSEKVARGGSYADGADSLRSAARLRLNGTGDALTGFRLVRSLN